MQLARHYELARLDDKAAACFLQAGRGALAMHAHSEAIALAQRGIACLNRIGDVTRHAALVLDLDLLLGAAQHHGGRFAESMETYRQTAELAARLGAGGPRAGRARLRRAALALQPARAGCGAAHGPGAGRARPQRQRAAGLPARAPCTGARGSAPVDELMELLDEAVGMARRLGDPRALIESLRTRLSLDRSPERTAERIALIDEMLTLARRIDDKQLHMELLAFRIYDIVAVGDCESWERDLNQHEQLADQIDEPFYSYNVRAMRTAQALNGGLFDEAEALAMRALEAGQKLGVDNVEGVMGMQIFTIRREQGRLREVAPLVRHFVEERGAGAAWRPGLALIYADLDRLAEAQTEFERLADGRFCRGSARLVVADVLCYLVEVCDRLRDPVRAAVLHDLLQPYHEQTVVVGNATVCLGATSRFLGQLAATMGRWDVAESYFRHALASTTACMPPPGLRTRGSSTHACCCAGAPADAARAAGLLGQAEVVRAARDAGPAVAHHRLPRASLRATFRYH